MRVKMTRLLDCSFSQFTLQCNVALSFSSLQTSLIVFKLFDRPLLKQLTFAFEFPEDEDDSAWLQLQCLTDCRVEW